MNLWWETQESLICSAIRASSLQFHDRDLHSISWSKKAGLIQETIQKYTHWCCFDHENLLMDGLKHWMQWVQWQVCVRHNSFSVWCVFCWFHWCFAMAVDVELDSDWACNLVVHRFNLSVRFRCQSICAWKRFQIHWNDGSGLTTAKMDANFGWIWIALFRSQIPMDCICPTSVWGTKPCNEKGRKTFHFVEKLELEKLFIGKWLSSIPHLWGGDGNSIGLCCGDEGDCRNNVHAYLTATALVG